MSFTDQKPFTVTEEDETAPWGGNRHGRFFRCRLCGYKFKKNDVCRWVYNTNPTVNNGNFFVCNRCDSEYVLSDVEAQEREWKQLVKGRFWHYVAYCED